TSAVNSKTPSSSALLEGVFSHAIKTCSQGLLSASAAAYLAAQLLNGAQPRHRFGQLGGSAGVVELGGLLLHPLERMLARLLGGGLVQIFGLHRGAGQHGDHLGLHFQKAARDVEVRLLTTLLHNAYR